MSRHNEITIGSRKSPLAQAQVREVIEEIQSIDSTLTFKCKFVETYGDLNQQISLRTLDKTDFFTRELDRLLLEKKCRITVHSAKDLPEPLPNGLQVVALTVGKDPSDSLVLREGETLESLPEGAIIATSSLRREQVVKAMRNDLKFIDLRGTIEERLAKLENREADGVVVAEAALIRLGLTHLNRVRLPGETAAHQGQLAVVARNDDDEMKILFSAIDAQ